MTKGSFSDEALVMALKAGDTEAFDELAARWRARLVRVAWRILGSYEDAEEAAQDALLIGYLRIHHFDPTIGSGNFGNWLKSVVRHRAQHRATYWMTRRRQQTVPFDNYLRDTRPSPLDALLSAERRRWAVRALESLPVSVRPVVYRVLLGERPDHTARDLGLTRGAVAGMMARARQALRRRVLWRFSVTAPHAAA